MEDALRDAIDAALGIVAQVCAELIGMRSQRQDYVQSRLATFAQAASRAAEKARADAGE